MHNRFAIAIPLGFVGVLLATVAGLAAAPDRGAGVDAAVVDTFRGRNGAIFTDWD